MLKNEKMKKKSAIASLGRTPLMLAAMSLLLVVACQQNQPTPSANEPTMAVASAETNYQATTGNGSYGTLQQLVDSQSLNRPIDKGESRGYKFEVRVTNAPSYEAVATPLQYGLTGLKSYYLNSTSSAIHVADKKGAEASASDPEL
jgi:hypothetical protein